MTLGADNFLWAYGIISMIVYALASLIQFVFKIKFILNFKQKVICLLAVISGMAILMTAFISIAYFVSHDQTYAGYYVFILILSIVTFGASLYYLLVSQVINFIIKVIEYNLNHEVVSNNIWPK